MLLTDSLLLDYKRCQRRTFLKFYGDFQRQDPNSDFLLKLQRESQVHRETVIDRQNFQRQVTPQGDLYTKASQTLLFMQQGVECITQGILLGTVPDEDSSQPEILPLISASGIIDRDVDITLVGKPTLLVKSPGKSVFGDWVYTSSNVLFGKRPKSEYKLVGAFHAQLLAVIQDCLPETAWLILRRQNPHGVDLQNWLPRMHDILANCVKMLRSRQEPELFISRQRCSLCRWHGYCYNIAHEQQHLSLVPGITPNRYQELKSLGITTLESLATHSFQEMKKVMGREITTKLQQQAKSILHNQAILSPEATQIVLEEIIPTAAFELYFDIEAEPERQVDYLLGVVLVDRQSQTQQFHPFLAEKPEDEGIIWSQFLEWVWRYPHAPIFHFSEYEVDTLKRLAKTYHTPSEKIDPILSRCVDLHQWVRILVTLPVENYSLKSVANWLGFQWRERGIKGDQTVFWYDQWLKTGDRTPLEAILQYNEDDCQATYLLKDWLVEFCSTFKVSNSQLKFIK